MYATVKDNQVTGVLFHLPRSFGNVSGFHNLPVSDLIGYGFYPMEEVKPDLAFVEQDDGEIDEDGNPVLRKVFTQQYGAATDDVQADKVVRTYAVIDIPANDVKAERNRPTLKKIAAIEAKQARAVREAALGDATYLRQIEGEIAALRMRLV